MTIKIHPDVGQILICDFNGFSQPEITKRRPVINLTPRRRVGTVCTVVPLSTTAPDPVQGWNRAYAYSESDSALLLQELLELPVLRHAFENMHQRLGIACVDHHGLH